MKTCEFFKHGITELGSREYISVNGGGRVAEVTGFILGWLVAQNEEFLEAQAIYSDYASKAA